MKTIAFAGNKNVTMDCMKEIIKEGYKISHLITLTPKQGKKHSVPGYMDLSNFACNRKRKA